MNQSEKKLLRKVIYSVVHHDANLWWELKRQIFNFGYELHYPLEYEFENAALLALEKLSHAEQQALIVAWRKARPPRAELPDSQIVRAYIPMIIEEVVKRARSAAHRTVTW